MEASKDFKSGDEVYFLIYSDKPQKAKFVGYDGKNIVLKINELFREVNPKMVFSSLAEATKGKIAFEIEKIREDIDFHQETIDRYEKSIRDKREKIAELELKLKRG